MIHDTVKMIFNRLTSYDNDKYEINHNNIIGLQKVTRCAKLFLSLWLKASGSRRLRDRINCMFLSDMFELQ